MAKDILAAVGEFMANENMNDEILLLIEENENNLKKLYDGLLYNTLKEAKNEEIQLEKLKTDIDLTFQEINQSNKYNEIVFYQFKDLIFNKISQQYVDFLKLKKQVIQNEWKSIEKDNQIQMKRLSDFKGPVASLAKSDNMNWDGLYGKEYFYNPDITSKLADDLFDYVEVDGNAIYNTSNTDNNYGEFYRNWLYLIDWASYNLKDSLFNEKDEFNINSRHAYNNDTNKYDSEIRYKGNTLLGVYYSDALSYISLGGSFTDPTDDDNIIGINDIRADGNFKVKNKLVIDGIEQNEIIDQESLDAIGFESNTQSVFNKSVYCYDKVIINNEESDKFSFKSSNNIITDKKLISTGGGCYLKGTGNTDISAISTDNKDTYINKSDLLFDGDIKILNNHDLIFSSAQASIIFGDVDFYKGGMLTVSKLNSLDGINLNESIKFKYDSSSDETTADFNINKFEIKNESSDPILKIENGVFKINEDGTSEIDINTSGEISMSSKANITIENDNNSVVFSNDSITLDSSTIILDGIVETTKELNTGGNITVNGGDGTLFGTATKAKYADLAENYKINPDFKGIILPGDIVSLTDDSDSEFEIVPYNENLPLAGVVSTAPGYLLNSKDLTKDTNCYVEIALNGRVPVKVDGDVFKGMFLIPSLTKLGTAKGIYKKDLNNLTMIEQYNIIGIALSDSINNIVEAKVK